MTLIQWLSIGALSLLVTLFSEISSWVTKKLTGTPLSGFAALFTTAAFSLLGGILYFIWTIIPANYVQELIAVGSVIMVGATFVFNILIKNVPALHVTPTAPTQV